MNSQNDLQKMLLISPKVYESLKHLLLTNEKSEMIEDSMEKILKNKNLNDYDKWNLYKHSQMHHANMKRKNNYNLNDLKKSFNNNINKKNEKKTLDSSTNTKIKFSRDKETNTEQQSSPIRHSHGIGAIAGAEKVYENSMYESFNDSNINDDHERSDHDYSLNNVTLDYSDVQREEALKDVPKDVRIIKKLQTSDPKNYSSYQLSDGSVVDVPIPQKNKKKPKKQRHKSESTPKNNRRYSDDPEWLPY